MRASCELRIYPEHKPSRPPHYGTRTNANEKHPLESESAILTPEEYVATLDYCREVYDDVRMLKLLLGDEDLERIIREVNEGGRNEEDQEGRDENKSVERFKKKLQIRKANQFSSKRASLDIQVDIAAAQRSVDDDSAVCQHSKMNVLRLMFAEFNPTEIVTRNTVGYQLFGSYGEAMNTLYLRSWFYFVSVLLLWWVGFVVSVCAIFGRLPPVWTLTSLLMLPATINGILLTNVSVLYCLLMCFDFYYCIGNMISFLTSFSIYNGHTQQTTGFISVFSICYGLSSVWVFLADAQPAAIRKRNSILLIGSGMVSLIVIMLGLYLHWMALSQDEVLELPHVIISASGQCSYSLVTLLSFFMRNLATAVLFPGSFVLGEVVFKFLCEIIP